MNVSCPHCGHHITLEPTQAGAECECPSCGKAFAAPVLPEALPVAQAVATRQPSKERISGMLQTVGILSIIWAVLAMFRGMLYGLVSEIASNESYWRGTAFFLLNSGVLIGAILMLNRVYLGLLVYTVAQGLNLLLIAATVVIYSEDWGVEVAGCVGLFFFVPPLILLLLAWSADSRTNFPPPQTGGDG